MTTSKKTPAKRTAAKRTPASAAKVVKKELPVQILDVSRDVTANQAADYFARGDVERVRGAIGFSFLVAQGKGKSVRAMAESMGISKSTADRANRAAEIVWRFGSDATVADAQAAIVLVNAISAGRLGKVDTYLKPGRQTPAQLRKQLGTAQRKATKDLAAKRAEATSNQGPRTRTQTLKTDASKIHGCATLLTGVKSGQTADAEDVRTLLAHAIRIAVDSGLEAAAIAAEVDAATTDAPAKPAKKAAAKAA